MDLTSKIEQEICHAWYSQEAAELWGTVIYEDRHGEPVHCTCISRSSSHGCAWPDIKFVGFVTLKLLGRTKGSLSDIEEMWDREIDRLGWDAERYDEEIDDEEIDDDYDFP